MVCSGQVRARDVKTLVQNGSFVAVIAPVNPKNRRVYGRSQFAVIYNEACIRW